MSTHATTTEKDAAILIVGGGIGGLTAALSIMKFGYRVKIFEQTTVLKEIGAGVAVGQNGMHALNFLGLGERLAAQADPIVPVIVGNYQTSEPLRVGLDLRTLTAKFGAGYHHMLRSDLHSALLNAVASHDPEAIHLDHRFDRA